MPLSPDEQRQIVENQKLVLLAGDPPPSLDGYYRDPKSLANVSPKPESPKPATAAA